MPISSIVSRIVNRLVEAKRVHILAHSDADGISAAATIARALASIGIRFEIRFIPVITREKLEEAYKDREDLEGERLFLDLGSSFDLPIEDPIIIDHHSFSSSSGLLFNSRIYGLQTPTAVLAYLVSRRIDAAACRYSHLPLVGARGDLGEKMLKMDDPLIEDVLGEAIRCKKVRKKIDRLTYDASSRPLYETIASVIRDGSPYYKRLESVKETLKSLSLEGKKFDELSEQEKQILRERFEIRVAEILEILDEDKPMLRTVHEFSALLNSLARSNHPDIAFSIAYGERRELYVRGYNIYKEERSGLGKLIPKARKGKIDYMGMEVYDLDLDYRQVSVVTTILHREKPQKILIGVGNMNGKKKISVRGPKKYRLGEVVRKAAMLVGGEGGGHDEAAGATIPGDSLMDFLDTLRSLILRSKNRSDL